MSIFGLIGLIAAIAFAVTIVIGLLFQRPEQGSHWLIAYIRNFLAVFFIFSGVVKAIDPVGTSIKIGEYFNIFTEYVPALTPLWDFLAGQSLAVSIFTIVLEIALGVSLLLGTLPSTTLLFYFGLTLFFTILTAFSAYTGKVTDCGCFGDFVKLKPFESFLKDVGLMVLIFLMIAFRKHIKPIFSSKGLSLGILGVLTLAALGFNLRNYYDLPIVDFRAYNVGTNLIEGKSEVGLDPGEVKIMYTLEKENGESKVVSSDDYMAQKMWEDKAWKLNKDKTTKQVIREPELPKIKDFMIFDAMDQEVADSILAKPGYQFFVAAHDIGKSKKNGFQKINQTLKKAAVEGITAIGLTSSDLTTANTLTDNAYKFHTLDATPIKTMIRANPGVVLLKDGVVMAKWHHRVFPTWAEIKKQFNIKQQPVY